MYFLLVKFKASNLSLSLSELGILFSLVLKREQK